MQYTVLLIDIWIWLNFLHICVIITNPQLEKENQ